MSGPTLVIELAEPLSPAALREFRALMVGLSSHFAEKRPGFFDVNVPAGRLGVEDRREKDWRKPFPLPLLGNTIADEELGQDRPPRLQRSDRMSPHIQPSQPPTRRTYAVTALAGGCRAPHARQTHRPGAGRRPPGAGGRRYDERGGPARGRDLRDGQRTRQDPAGGRPDRVGPRPADGEPVRGGAAAGHRVRRSGGVLADEGLLRADHAELVPLRIGQHGP